MGIGWREGQTRGNFRILSLGSLIILRGGEVQDGDCHVRGKDSNLFKQYQGEGVANETILRAMTCKYL